MVSAPSTPSGRRGFTLVELIVTVLVLGVLAGLAVVGYSHFTSRAQAATAQANLKQLATAVAAQAAARGDTDLDRGDVLAALEDSSVTVVDGLGAAGQTWTLLGPTDATDDPSQIAVGFDDGPDTAVSATSGSRVAFVTVGGGNVYSETVDVSTANQTPVVHEESAKTPEDVLGSAIPAVPELTGSFDADTSTSTVSWESTPGATSYEVRYQIDGGAWVTATQTTTTSSRTLDPGQSVIWQVAARSLAGLSDWSAQLTHTQVPAVPELTGVFDPDTSTSSVTWEQASGATSYVVRHRVDGGDWVQETPDELTASLTLDPGQSIDWQVAAVNTTGTSAWSSTVSHQAVPGAPTLTGSLDPATGASSVSWTAPASAASYEVRYQIDGGAWTSASQSTTTASRTISAGQAIAWQVAGVNTTGQGAWSTTITHQAAPGVPVLTGSLDSTSGASTISWPTVTGATSYQVRYAIDGGAWTTSTQSTTTASRTISAGQAITWQVAATNTAGTSSWSSAVTHQAIPGVPVVTGSITQATGASAISWPAVTSATSYQVRYAIDGGAWTTASQTDLTASRTVSAGQAIAWQVAAVNATGTSAWSTTVTHTRVPTSPVLAGSLNTATGVSTVSWTAPAGATSYVARYRVDGGAWEEQTTTLLTGAKTLTAGQIVEWQVAAVSAGGQGAWSTALTHQALPATVGVVTVSNVTATSATLTWATVPTATSYKVTNTTTGATQTVTTPTVTVTGVENTTVKFTVAAVNTTGAGAASPTASVNFPVASVAKITYNTAATSCTDKTIIVPASGTVTGTINWGDGTSAAMTATPTHTYATAGTYTVTINGTFTSFGSSTTATGLGDAPCLTGVTTWKNTGTTSLANAFRGAKNLTSLPAGMDTTSVADMTNMFYSAAAFNQPLALDTENVTTMANMFAYATVFNQPLAFNTANVTNMSGMFSNATAFNQPLEFDTANVTNMRSMFDGATVFNQPLEFDTANVTAMNSMFSNATAFNQPLEFDTANVKVMNNMFSNARSLDRDLAFNTANVTTMNSMFQNAVAFNRPLEFDTASVTDMYAMFYNAAAFNQPLAFNTAKVTDLSSMFYGAAAFNQPLVFNTANVTAMRAMFYSAAAFNQHLTFNTANVTSMSDMFANARAFDQTLGFDTKNVTDMSNMFSNASVYNQPLTFNTANATTMRAMFYNAAAFNQPLAFNTAKVTDLSSMFYGAAAFNQPLAFNTANVTDMDYMFYRAAAFDQNLSAWSVAKSPSHVSFDTGASAWKKARPLFV